jgi:L,D-peptidoglycan transpeptidase YkuD (ErfK/YbiS/YcfS/YnhG family)
VRRGLLCALVAAVAGATPVLVHAARGPGSPVAADLAPSAEALAALDRSAPDLQQLHPAPPLGYAVPAATSAAPSRAAAAAPTPAPSSSSATARPGASPARTAVPARTAAPAAGAGLPLPVPVGSSTQVVTVVAASSRSTTARLTAWQRGASGWTAVVGPVTAHIGAAGVGRASETTSRTPAGTFPLTEAFGRLADPGTALPYRVINGDDWWVSDAGSALYNRFTECARAACPFDTSAGEHLTDAGASYDRAVVIDYNRRPAVPGAGSAFFLHVTNGAATAGCVAVPETSLVAIMRWLQPSAHPLISIGVG